MLILKKVQQGSSLTLFDSENVYKNLTSQSKKNSKVFFFNVFRIAFNYLCNIQVIDIYHQVSL
jgi:hypothetical protein